MTIPMCISVNYPCISDIYLAITLFQSSSPLSGPKTSSWFKFLPRDWTQRSIWTWLTAITSFGWSPPWHTCFPHCRRETTMRRRGRRGRRRRTTKRQPWKNLGTVTWQQYPPKKNCSNAQKFCYAGRDNGGRRRRERREEEQEKTTRQQSRDHLLGTMKKKRTLKSSSASSKHSIIQNMAPLP